MAASKHAALRCTRRPEVGADEVACWLPLVRSLARRLLRAAPASETLDDLEGDGYEALIHALSTFDRDKGATLAGWISVRVRGAMIDGMRRRHPGPFRRRDVRERLGSIEFVSLDAPLTRAGADADLTLAEVLEDREAVPVADVVEDRGQVALQRRVVRRALDNLSKREQRILVMRHVGEMTAAEVAACEGLSEGSVHRIERFAQIKAAAATRPPARRVDGLSAHELEVLEDAAAGATARETAKRLRRSAETIKSHRKAAIEKLGARNMCQAVSNAHRLGILH
jgi:RNA polymerase sigma factor for flagellar operon FliA